MCINTKVKSRRCSFLLYSVDFLSLGSMNKNSKWRHENVISHVAFFPSIVISLLRKEQFLELSLFVFPVLIASFIFNRARAPRDSLIGISTHVLAHILFGYGCAHIFAAPTFEVRIIYCIFLFWIMCTHLGRVFRFKISDEAYFTGIYVIPGFLCTVVSRFGSPILSAQTKSL